MYRKYRMNFSMKWNDTMESRPSGDSSRTSDYKKAAPPQKKTHLLKKNKWLLLQVSNTVIE